MLYLFEHPEAVNSISLQPGANGNFFASASKDGILRLFDTRRNKTGELDILKHPSSFYYTFNSNKISIFVRCCSPARYGTR